MENTTNSKGLLKRNWKEAAVTSGQHLKRMLEMYDELGLEVHVEEVESGQIEGCTSCYEDGGEKIFRVYTRNIEK